MLDTPKNAHNPGLPTAPNPAYARPSHRQLLNWVLTGLGTGLVGSSLVGHFLVGGYVPPFAKLFGACCVGAFVGVVLPVREMGGAKLIRAFWAMFWPPLVLLSVIDHSHPLGWGITAPIALVGVAMMIVKRFVSPLG